MVASTPADHERAALRRGGLRRVLVTLCTTEIVSWGILFYALPVLAGDISSTTDWSRTAITAAFSAGLLVSAVLGIPVGRLLDRYGPRWIMTGGSALAVPALVLIALAPNLVVFAAGWLVAGIAMSAVLYLPAFAALTRWYGARRVRALTTLTLIGGLASTVFAPSTAFLVSQVDWRATYLILAGVLGVITVPGHWWGLRAPWPPAGRSIHDVKQPTGIPRTLPFLALAIGFALVAFASSAVVVNLVALLQERGLGTGIGALALGLGGAGQVLGRIGYSPLMRRIGVRARTALIPLGVALTTALLGLLTAVVALIAVAVVAGMVRGLMTLLQATAVTERWGTALYGWLSGLLFAPITIVSALAPFGGSAVAELVGGYSGGFLVLSALAMLGVGCGLASVPRVRPASVQRS